MFNSYKKLLEKLMWHFGNKVSFADFSDHGYWSCFYILEVAFGGGGLMYEDE